MRVLLLLVFVVGVGLLIVYGKYGTVEPCRILRVQVRQEAARQSDFGQFISVATPDSVVDALLSARVGPLTPGKCLTLLLNQYSVRPAVTTPETSAAGQAAPSGPAPVDYGLTTLPTSEGSCAWSHISSLEQRLQDMTNGLFMPGSGSAVRFSDGGYQVSYAEIGEIARSKVGDPVLVCLVRIPKCRFGKKLSLWNRL